MIAPRSLIPLPSFYLSFLVFALAFLLVVLIFKLSMVDRLILGAHEAFTLDAPLKATVEQELVGVLAELTVWDYVRGV